MEAPTWAAYLAAWLATLALWFISSHFRKRKLNLPPGPKPWPIIGNLNLMGPLPHHSVHQLIQKYGPIMQLRLGTVPVVVGSSVEMAKIFLKTMDQTFSSRPRSAAGKYTNYDHSNITWSDYGPYWRQARRLCLMELFSPKRLDYYEYIRKEETLRYMGELYESAGKGFPLKQGLMMVSLNVICRMVLGRRYVDLDGSSLLSAEEFKKLLDELLLLNGVLNIGDWISWLAVFDLQGYVKRMKAVNKRLNVFYEHVLDEHAERIGSAQNYVAQDMVDHLLQLAKDPDLEVKLERHHIKALTQELLGGGTESSTVTVEWAIAELLRKPENFKKATEELDRVIGRERWVEEKDIPNLPFVEAIVKETMRLHPVAPLLVPRMAREDCKVAGYDIPKGTRVMVSVYTIGRDPSVWNQPLEFNPSRFIGKSIDVKGRDYELLPFGSGRRMCVGYSLGLKVIQATLAKLLQGFDWKLANNAKPEDLNMEEVFGLSSPKKHPTNVVAEPRLPPHLYSL